MKYYENFNELYKDWETKNQNPDVAVFNNDFMDTVLKLSKVYAKLIACGERLLGLDMPLDSEYIALLRQYQSTKQQATNTIAYQRDPMRKNQTASATAKYLDSQLDLIERVDLIAQKVNKIEAKNKKRSK